MKLAKSLPAGKDFLFDNWEETPKGFQALLTALFQTSPPTALIIDEVTLFVAAQQFLAQHRIQAPAQVSLVATDSDPSFALCQPSISHIRWNPKPLVGRIVRWANNVSQGRSDLKQTLFPAEFVRSGSIGPVREG